MQLLVMLAVTLLGVAADGDYGSYKVRWQPVSSVPPQYRTASQQYHHAAVQPQYSSPPPAKRPVGGPAPTDAVQKATKEFNRLYKEAAARAAATPDDHKTYEPQQYNHAAVQPQYSSPPPAKRPVGGPAPADAVQKATEEFNRLYKEAAARASAAPDDHKTYQPQLYNHAAVQPQYSSPRPAKRPVGGPAPADAVQKATEEFNSLYKEAAARAAATPYDHKTYEPQQYNHAAVQPQYSSPRPAKRPVGGPAPADAVQKATEEFNRLYKEAAARASAAPDDHKTYEPQQYHHAAVQPQYSSPRPAKRPVGGPAPADAVQKATEEFNRLYKEAAARVAATPDDHKTYELQQYNHAAVQPQYSSPRPAKRPVGGPAPADAVQKATEEFNRLYREVAARAAATPDDHKTYQPQQYNHAAVQPQYSSPRPAKHPVGGPAPVDAVQKATEEFNRLYKEAAARVVAATTDDPETYEPQQYRHAAVQPQYSSPRPAKRPVGGPAPTDAVQKATEEFNRLYKEADARAAAATDDHETYEPQQYHAAVQPQFSSPLPAKRPVGGPAPTDAVQKAIEEFNRLYKEAAARAAAAPDDHQIFASRPQQPVHVPQQHAPRSQFHAPSRSYTGDAQSHPQSSFSEIRYDYPQSSFSEIR